MSDTIEVSDVTVLPQPAQDPLTMHVLPEDGSGYIDAAELRDLCDDLGIHLSKSELNEALDMLDKDGSGAIEFEEFVDWWRSM